MKKLLLILAIVPFLNASADPAYDNSARTLAQFQALRTNAIVKQRFASIVAQGGPSFEQAQTAIVQTIRRILKDPESAIGIDFGMPTYNTRATKHKDWIIRFQVNAKNSFGGYTGTSIFTICWANGGIDYEGQRDLEAWYGVGGYLITPQ